MFSEFASTKYSSTLETKNQLVTYLQNKLNNISISDIDTVWDWKSFLTPYIWAFENFSKHLVFLIIRTDNGNSKMNCYKCYPLEAEPIVTLSSLLAALPIGCPHHLQPAPLDRSIINDTLECCKVFNYGPRLPAIIAEWKQFFNDISKTISATDLHDPEMFAWILNHTRHPQVRTVWTFCQEV